ncbi:cytochrome P450 [Dacryopinax primogenitus]|uniref:Cytochrome P450 n=1 Tax=Dacryopinax primogenitus (strain DJM 731) TaxID=1858805 RepID=M5G1Q0_DACPD|nr:cytochrome P450 [Dacryopinax primogenitus]EJU02639.1 cytochrome P450 [Dacryopinax primogenitus]
MFSLPQLAFGAGLLCLVFLYALRGPKGKLPPGPPGLPIVGNLLEIPTKQMFLKFDEWAKKYGDLYTVNVAGKKIVVLSSAKSSGDVLDRKSGATSGRPRFVMAGEIMCHNLLYMFMSPGEQWRRLRRVTHEGFNIRACQAYYPFQEQEAANLVRSIMAEPTDLGQKLKHATAAATWRSLYSGPSLTEEDEAKVCGIDNVGETVLGASMPMAFLVDVIPAMKMLPNWMAGWKAWGEEWFRESGRFFHGLLDDGKQQKKGVEHHVGFIASTAPSFKKFGVTEQEAAWTAGGLFIAGVETSGATLHYFIQAMVLNPEVCRAAQKHVDSVVGNRPPTFDDRDQLPYVVAVVKETIRWRPVAALGVPHVADEDLEYRGYVIPKGTQIIGNIWSIAHDPAYFPYPEQFQPSRFIDSSGNIKEPFPNYHDDIVAFGAGRRVCPGRDFANNMLFIDMAYLLWAFDFELARNEMGTSMPDTMKFDDHGLIILPVEFPCVVKPRRNDLGELLGDM